MEKSYLNNLMKRIQIDRDEMAFSEIFDFFAPKINAYFIQNNIKLESSEELTQEVLSAVWVKSNLYDYKKSALSTWIFTIARNKKIDFFRKNSKINFQEEDIREFLYQDREIDLTKENEAKNEVNVDVLSLKYLLTENPWIIFSQAVTASRPMQDLFQRVVEKNQR